LFGQPPAEFFIGIGFGTTQTMVEMGRNQPQWHFRQAHEQVEQCCGVSTAGKTDYQRIARPEELLFANYAGKPGG